MIIFDNVCDSETLDILHQDLDSKSKESLVLNSKKWDDTLTIGIDGIVTVIPVSDQISKLIRKILIKKIPDTRLYNMNFVYQVMPYQAGISKHYDKLHYFAATLYLNKVWDLNYGGILIYEEDSVLKAHCPTYNTLIVNNNKALHLVTSVTNAAPVARVTLQCFGT